MCVHYICALTGDLFTDVVGRATKLYYFCYSSHYCVILITAEMACLDTSYDAKVKKEGGAVDHGKEEEDKWTSPR